MREAITVELAIMVLLGGHLQRLKLIASDAFHVQYARDLQTVCVTPISGHSLSPHHGTYGPLLWNDVDPSDKQSVWGLGSDFPVGDQFNAAVSGCEPMQGTRNHAANLRLPRRMRSATETPESVAVGKSKLQHHGPRSSARF